MNASCEQGTDNEEQQSGCVPESRPRVWTTFLAFGSVYVSLLFFILFMGTLAVLSTDLSTRRIMTFLRSMMDTDDGAVLMMACSDLSFAFIILLACWLSPVAFHDRLRLYRGNFGWSYLVYVALGVLGVGFSFSGLSFFGGWEIESGVELDDLLVNANSMQFIALIFMISVGAGVFEELFFRGYLQTRFVERWGTIPGIVVASLLFGLVHHDWAHSSFAFIVGLWLGWIAEKTGSIRVPIIAHTVNNFVACLLAISGLNLATTFGALVELTIGVCFLVASYQGVTRRHAEGSFVIEM